jgi:hypothetical protein
METKPASDLGAYIFADNRRLFVDKALLARESRLGGLPRGGVPPYRSQMAPRRRVRCAGEVASCAFRRSAAPAE